MSSFAEESLSDESLQRELQNKDDIILALTEQLEGAVDQLDRLKRSGVKEGPGEGRATSPFSLASQVSDALEAYEELAPAEHFERIESGIEQILNLISSGSVQLNSISATDNQEASSEEDDSFWEETKARLLGGEVAESSSDSTTVSHSELEANSETTSPNEQTEEAGTINSSEPVVVPPMPGEPKPVEDLTDLVAMEEGLTERDQYIVYLVARLRQAEQEKFPEIDLNELVGVPDQLIDELMEVKKKLEDQLRQSEVAASLERASLTRERSKLFQVKQYLAREVQRLGAIAQQQDAGESPENQSTSRWGKFFDTKK